MIMTLRVMLLLVIAASLPPSSSCPPYLQTPPAALGPAVLPAAGNIPQQGLLPILLQLLLLVVETPPAHLLCEHFLVFFVQLRPFFSAALLHILLTTRCPTQQREAGFCVFFLAQITNDLPLPPKVYLFTIIASFFLPFGFSWCIARSSSPCSSSLPGSSVTPSFLFNLFFLLPLLSEISSVQL